MATIVEIVDAVKGLTPEEREDLFGKLRELGLEPSRVPQPPDPAYYASEEFTNKLTEHFHHAKRRALGAE
jgi:hypothetical protein